MTHHSSTRLIDLMADIDEVLSRHRATTQEVIVAARQMAVSAAAQMADDNPGCNRTALVSTITDDLRRALSLRLTLFAGKAGEA